VRAQGRHQMGRFEGKVVLITGAAQGIGRGIAEAFGREGASVALLDVRGDQLDDVVSSLAEAGAKSVPLVGDVSRPEDVERCVGEAVATLGPIDVLVNNAGVDRHKPFLETTVEDWDWITGVNLRGTFLCCRAVLPSMVERRQGSIVNITSMTALAY